ncbi:MAG: DsbA family protein [Tumebacillaceae bacterium]
MQKKFLYTLLVVLTTVLLAETGLLFFTVSKVNRVESAFSSLSAAQNNDSSTLLPKEPSPISVDISNAPSTGNQNAKITLVEFTDFECDFCKASQPTIHAVLQKYDGKIKHVVRNYPISSLHSGAVNAAMGSLCANDQNKYWEFFDQLFEKSNGGGSLTNTVLKETANALGMNQDTFSTCLDSKKYIDRIQKDYEDGSSYGITGTPTFFINGHILTGNQSIEEFSKIIDEELKK